MKRFLTALLVLTLLLSLSACSGGSWRDDVATDTLIDTGLTALADGVNYVDVEDDFLDAYFTRADWIVSFDIRIAEIASNLNQVGIYHVQEGHANEMKEQLAAYLSKSLEQNQAWYDSYIPEETPKLRDAEVKVYGNYVVYAILSTDDRATFFGAIESALAAN